MVHQAKKFAPYVLAALAALVLTHCRNSPQDGGSQTESLDNFVAGKTVTLNSCGFDYRGDQDKHALLWDLNGHGDKLDLRTRFDGSCTQANWNEPACRAAFGVVAAIPVQVSAPFFLAGGRVSIGGDPPCARPALSPAEADFANADNVTSYWCHPAGDVPHLVLPYDAPLIRHSALSLFGYYYVEDFVPALANLQEGGPLTAQQAQALVQSFNASKDTLGEKLLSDVTGDSLTRLQKFATGDHDRYVNYAFAQTIDSAGCSDATRANFKSQFANTYAFWHQGPHSLAAQFGK